MKKKMCFQMKIKSINELGELVEGKGQSLQISGYGSTGDIDRGNDRVMPSAFSDTIVARGAKSPIPILLGHDGNKLLGSWDKLEVDGKGLFVEGEVKYDIDGCIEKIRKGDLRGLSIGYIVEAYQVEDGKGHIIYDSAQGIMPGYDCDDCWADGTVRTITKLELVEISVVSTPMNPYAFISSIKDFFAQEKKDFDFSQKAIEKLVEKKEETTTEVVETETPTEVVEESPAETVPAEVIPEETETKETQETVVETPAVETTAPVDTAPEEVVVEQETTAQENNNIVKVDEEPAPETPKSISAEEVKALIESTLEEKMKPVQDALDVALKSLADNATQATADQKRIADLESSLATSNLSLKQLLEVESQPQRRFSSPTHRKTLTYGELFQSKSW